MARHLNLENAVLRVEGAVEVSLDVPVESLLLLERVSKGRGVCVDPSRVPEYARAMKREYTLQFLREHAPDNVIRVKCWLDVEAGVLRSKPTLHLVPSAAIVASEGHTIVDAGVNIELLCCLRDSGSDGNDLADKVVIDHVSLWDYMAAELATDADRDNRGVVGAAFRDDVRREVFRSLYGARPPAWQSITEAARFRDIQGRVLSRWHELWLEGSRDTKRLAMCRRRLQAALVGLEVAREAERLGCCVVGFCFNEPIIECPSSADVLDVQSKLKSEACRLLLRQP